MAFQGTFCNIYPAVKAAAFLLSACCFPRQWLREIVIIMLVGPGPPLLSVEFAVACRCGSDFPALAEIIEG